MLLLLGMVPCAMACLLRWGCCARHAQQGRGGLGRRGAEGQRGILLSQGCLCGRLARHYWRRCCCWAPVWAVLLQVLRFPIPTPALLTGATRADIWPWLLLLLPLSKGLLLV